MSKVSYSHDSWLLRPSQSLPRLHRLKSQTVPLWHVEIWLASDAIMVTTHDADTTHDFGKCQ